MGLFTKAAPNPVPPVPSGPEPDTLEYWQAQLEKEQATLADKATSKQDKENARHRRNYAADMVATFAEPGWNNQIKFTSPTPQHYHSLLKRMASLDLEPEWLDAQLSVFQVNLIKSGDGEVLKLEGWTREQYESLSAHIADLEEKIKQVEKEKTKERRAQAKIAPINDPENYCGPVAPPGFSVKEIRPNVYTHGTNINSTGEEATDDDYAKVLNWALFNFNFDSSFVFGQYGIINNREKGEFFTRSKLVMLQERLCQIVRTQKKNEPPKPEGDKPVGLFSKAAPAEEKIDTKKLAAEVSEVAAQESELGKLRQAAEDAVKLNIMQEARFRLGINHDRGPLTVKDKAQADDIMRERAMAFLELQYIHDRYTEKRHELEDRIADIDMVWTGPLQHFYEQNKPASVGKTWSLLYGDLKKRNIPASVALDPADVGEKQLQAFLQKLHDSKDPLAEKFDVKPQTTLSRNMKAIQDWFKAEWEKNKKPPAVPGLRVKHAEADRFGLAPAFDTAWDKIKKNAFTIGEEN